MTRGVIVLLVLRVLAAPVALRQEFPTFRSHDRFIVRHCAWPAIRASRSATDGICAAPAWPGLSVPFSLPPVTSDLAGIRYVLVGQLDVPQFGLDRLVDRLRC